MILFGPPKNPSNRYGSTQEARLQTCIDLIFLFLPLLHILRSGLSSIRIQKISKGVQSSNSSSSQPWKHQKKLETQNRFFMVFPIYIYTHQGSGFFPHPLTVTTSTLLKKHQQKVNAPKVESWRDSTQLESWCFLRNDDFKNRCQTLTFQTPKSR